MNIAIIDAEIIGKNKHRFPNLVCMKVSSYYKNLGSNVVLKLDYEDLDRYDLVFISKVFIKTDIPFEPEDKSSKTEETVVEFYKDNPILKLSNVRFGGTGFYYDKSPNLEEDIEHCKPDYHLYDDWIKLCIEKGAQQSEFVYYTDYSIGYLTRGCFRQCEFCVNRNKKMSISHSDVLEFVDKDRPKICFLDDNFFACTNWKNIINEVKQTKKRFQFKQGLDERLLTKEKILELLSWKYDGDYIFAFDNINDRELIESKLQLIYSLTNRTKHKMKFYVFCGFDRNGNYDNAFWEKDVSELFERLFILAKYNAIPYVMRHENFNNFKHSGIYIDIASWANQPAMFKKFDFKTFCMCRGMSGSNYSKYKRDIQKYLEDGGRKMAAWKYMEDFANEFPNVANTYFTTVPDSLIEYGIK